MNIRHDFMWGTLVHLGTNLWYEEGNYRGKENMTWKKPASPELRLDRKLWDNYMLRLRETGTNTVILDLADGVVYRSHPELAVKGAWSREELSRELEKLNSMGFEVIPKLNFSSTHDTWLKDYSRMLSTPLYYQVCKDLIDEVAEIFKPRFIHLGMDEEVYENQKDYDYVVIRQNDHWWHDLYYLIECVEKNNARAMIWSDYARHRPEEFIEKCPKSVVQCVWYYFNEFEGELSPVCECRVRPLMQLDQAGFELFPTGSACFYEENLELLAKYCREHISKEHLLGFMQTTWEAVQPEYTEMLEKGMRTMQAARALYEKTV